MAWLGERARFLSSFLRNPVATGAIAPSSRWLADRMVAGMGLREAGTIVELGPGTGAFTGPIIREMGRQSLLMAVELNPAFAQELAAKFPYVKVVNDSAERLSEHLAAAGRPSADSILSSLPWAGFPTDLQERLMGAIVAALRPGGRFATFAYVHARWFPAARRFRRLLESRFREVEATGVVWRNLPPAVVYRCTR